MDTLWLIDFGAQTQRIEPGSGRRVRGGAVRQKSKTVASSCRRSSPQHYLRGLSIGGGPGYGPNVYPEPLGYYSSTAVYSRTEVVPFISSTHVE